MPRPSLSEDPEDEGTKSPHTDRVAWSPVHDATTTEALAVLERLVRKHGPPLVLKSDNGSAFISGAFAAWSTRWQIVSLLSRRCSGYGIS